MPIENFIDLKRIWSICETPKAIVETMNSDQRKILLQLRKDQEKIWPVLVIVTSFFILIYPAACVVAGRKTEEIQVTYSIGDVGRYIMMGNGSSKSKYNTSSTPKPSRKVDAQLKSRSNDFSRNILASSRNKKVTLYQTLPVNTSRSQFFRDKRQYSYISNPEGHSIQPQHQIQRLLKDSVTFTNNTDTKRLHFLSISTVSQEQRQKFLDGNVTGNIKRKLPPKVLDLLTEIRHQYNIEWPHQLLVQGTTDAGFYHNVHILPCPSKVRYFLVGERAIDQKNYGKNQHRRECRCSTVGSLSTQCQNTTGQCTCLPNVTGRRCDKCKTGHWNLTKNVGCVDCLCDPSGSRGRECNPFTGQCDCKLGVGGQRCNECGDGFYGFSNDGCYPCPKCLRGLICDQVNGRCVCPENSRGPSCSQCIDGFWGWQPRFGCRECYCDRVGSIGHTCDTNTGQCQCREGYTGQACNDCAAGYFGYPECRRCDCDPSGSFSRTGEPIACDTNGQCPCKTLVVGLKCDTCVQSTFGLSSSNPEGCTRCFCFGRSSDCEQSKLSWGRIRMAEARSLRVQYQQPKQFTSDTVLYQIRDGNTYSDDAHIGFVSGFNLIPLSSGNVSIKAFSYFHQPVYFELPNQFYGDHTSSYGGYLYFSLATEIAQIPFEQIVFSRFPLVQIQAHSKLVLDFYEEKSNEYILYAAYKIPLHESHWKNHQNGQSVDRATFMVALQNLKHIFLRGSAFSDFHQIILQNVHMDSAIFINGSLNILAKEVERCKCPKRYEGLSCQNPGRGFYRLRNVTQTESFFIDELVGRAVPCHCNDRSVECDSETGVCKHCREYTGGDYCEICAEGYYGNPDANGCQPCPCPRTNRNFARGCKVFEGEVSCICKSGYSGKLCDACAPGYFGNPSGNENTICQPCDCNLDGIRSEGCDLITGECYCLDGVTGTKCDKCIADRHQLRDHNCRLCESCSLLLIDYVGLLSHHFSSEIKVMDLQEIAPPFEKVNEYEIYFKKSVAVYEDFLDARRKTLSFDNNGVLKLSSRAENIKYQWRKLASTASKEKNLFNFLQEDAFVLLSHLEQQRDNILHYVHDLKSYRGKDYSASLPTAIKQAQLFLDDIRQHDKSINNIRTTNQCAWSYLTFFGNTLDAAFDEQARTEIFWHDLNQSNFQISDLRVQSDRTFEIQGEIEDLLEHVVNLQNYVKEKYKNIHKYMADVRHFLSPSLLLKTEIIIKKKIDTEFKLSSYQRTLNNLEISLNITINKQEEQHREVKKHWLPKAQKHVTRLTERSNEYARHFQSTRNGARIALLASSVHKDLSETVTATKQICTEITLRVLAIKKALHLSYGNKSATEKAKISLNNSDKIKNKAIQKMWEVKGLINKLETHENIAEMLQLKIFNSGLRTNNIITDLQKKVTAVHPKKLAKESRDIGEYISKEMRKELKEVEDLQKNILKLHEKFAILDPNWEIKLGMAEENISLTKTNVRLANRSLLNLAEQVEKEKHQFGILKQTLHSQLELLHSKIAIARHAAGTIKVSLESPSYPMCVRSYLPASYGLSIYNNFVLNFALPNKTGNSPLLYIQGSENHFISLELYKRHVRLVWQLGGSTAAITHPLKIQSRDLKYDDAWYHVEANRTLHVGFLQVRPMHNYGSLKSSSVVSGHSNPENTRFFQTSRERIYLGGYPSHATQTEVQHNSGLNVVIHKLEIDNHQFGLWNFEKSEGKCGGAMIGPQESSSIERFFNGLGYAEIKKTRHHPYRRSLFALQMTFKTFDENALLFLAVDDKNNRSVSVTLSQGHIIFRVDYKNDLKLEINTTERYNTGRWVKIEAAREFVPKRGTESGILRVNSDQPLTGSPSVPITSNLLPDLVKAIYYLGGVPPGFRSATSKAPGADNPFLGCMRDVQVSGETYDPLQSSAVYGVEPSCKEVLTRAGFNGKGYMELQGQSLRKRAKISFVFRTLRPDCLLLLSIYRSDVSHDYDTKDTRGNYSISLINGHMHVLINSGQNLIRMQSNISLNDGEFHVMTLKKSGRHFELIIDDQVQETKNLMGSPTLINMPSDAGGLYIGGAPAEEEYIAVVPTFTKFEGLIRDLIINNRTVSFTEALAFSNVQIGRDGPSMGHTKSTFDLLFKTEPMFSASFTSTPKGCLKVGSYNYEPNAFKFGDDPNSYGQLEILKRNFWQQKFLISFDFRSFYPNGVIFFSPGSKVKQKHYVVLLIRDGQLVLIVRGHRRVELHLTAKLNDGEWHHVTIDSRERKVTMSVEIGQTDQKTSAQIKVPKKISTSNVLFVGGIPTHIPIKVPSELLSKLDTLKGCLRRFYINNRTQDLARPNKHKKVGQCFSQVEQGSYFPGDAYAVYKRNLNVGKFFGLEMDFRTSEPSGILMSLPEENGFLGFSLELQHGNIIFSRDLFNEVPLKVSLNLPSEYSLCDNRWHNVSLFYDFEQIVLQIDELPPATAVERQRLAVKAQSKTPLYIGGIPDLAPSGSLLSREFFKGCMRNVSIGNERLDWIDMDLLHNILFNECLPSKTNG